MNYDPKLRVAMAEIKNILKKHDIGGHVILTSPTHAEFAVFIEPTWSTARFVKGAKGNTGVHFKQRIALQVETEATAHMLFLTRDILGNEYLAFDKLCNQLSQTMAIEHTSVIGKPPDSVPED